MAKPLISFASFFAFIFVSFLLFSTFEMVTVEAKLCEKFSATWSGFCGNSGACDKQCRDWEGAEHGACHYKFPGYSCFCYVNC